MRLLLCAPTGRAAKRMTEATCFEAKTIHRLLEVDPKGGGFKRGDDNPLDCDLLVVDEPSIVDIMLMQALMKAVPDKVALLIVGDTNFPPSGQAKFWPMSSHPALCPSCVSPKYSGRLRRVASSPAHIASTAAPSPMRLVNLTRWFRPTPRPSTNARAWNIRPWYSDHDAALRHAAAKFALYRRHKGQEAGRAGRSEEGCRHCGSQRVGAAAMVEVE